MFCYLGVMHLHNKNVIHGDLALRNILYNTCKNHCAISDFGLAHHEKNFSPTHNLPVRWTAPEVFKTKR